MTPNNGRIVVAESLSPDSVLFEPLVQLTKTSATSVSKIAVAEIDLSEWLDAKALETTSYARTK